MKKHYEVTLTKTLTFCILADSEDSAIDAAWDNVMRGSWEAGEECKEIEHESYKETIETHKRHGTFIEDDN